MPASGPIRGRAIQVAHLQIETLSLVGRFDLPGIDCYLEVNCDVSTTAKLRELAALQKICWLRAS